MLYRDVRVCGSLCICVSVCILFAINFRLVNMLAIICKCTSPRMAKTSMNFSITLSKHSQHIPSHTHTLPSPLNHKHNCPTIHPHSRKFREWQKPTKSFFKKYFLFAFGKIVNTRTKNKAVNHFETSFQLNYYLNAWINISKENYIITDI